MGPQRRRGAPGPIRRRHLRSRSTRPGRQSMSGRLWSRRREVRHGQLEVIASPWTACVGHPQREWRASGTTVCARSACASEPCGDGAGALHGRGSPEGSCRAAMRSDSGNRRWLSRQILIVRYRSMTVGAASAAPRST